VFIIMLVMNGLAYFTLVTARQQNDATQVELGNKREQYAELQLIQQEIGVIEPKVRLLKQVRVSEAAWMTILRDVSRIIPDSVVLDGITAASTDKGITLRIAGKARDQEAVATFMENIRVQTHWAENPTSGAINSVQTGAVAGVAFDLTVPVREMVGGEL
jgi:Tfp pilus assembly protein PilN